MRKICKIKFQQLNETKLNRYQLGKLKKKKQNKTKQNKNITKQIQTEEKHRHAKRARVIFLVIGSRSIRRTVHCNDLVKFFGGLRCTARRKLEI